MDWRVSPDGSSLPLHHNRQGYGPVVGGYREDEVVSNLMVEFALDEPMEIALAGQVFNTKRKKLMHYELPATLRQLLTH